MITSENVVVLSTPPLLNARRWVLTRSPNCVHAFSFQHLIKSCSDDIVIVELLQRQNKRGELCVENLLHFHDLHRSRVSVRKDLAHSGLPQWGEGGSEGMSEICSNCEIFNTGRSMELISANLTPFLTVLSCVEVV